MRLSEKEKAILSAVQFRAEAAVPELAQITGIKEHVLHYHLNLFREQGVLRRWAFLDMFSLGFEEYEIYFSLASPSKKTRETLLAFLQSHERVVWLGELGGNFQFGITIFASNIHEVYEFVEGLARRFGNIFCRKSIAVIVSFTIFAKKYLSAKPLSPDHELVSLTGGRAQYQADETDLKVLAALYHPTAQSHRDMARISGLARTTIEYRLKKLQSAGVIQKYIYHISASRLGMQLFKLLVYAHGVQLPAHQKLFQFCRKHPHIVNFTHCLGSWDYEIGIDVPEAQMATGIVESLYDSFGALITDVEILPVFAQSNSVNFMKNTKPR